MLGNLASPGTCIALRVPAGRSFSVEDCVASGPVTPGAAKLLARMIEAKLAFLISGGTGSGKTMLAEGVPGLLPDLDVPARRRVEFRPSHLSYALRASGQVLHPAARLAPRGPTPKSRFPCASGR